MEGSTSLQGVVMAWFEPKNPQGPTNVSIVPMEDVRVPYIFKAPWAKPGAVAANKVVSPLEGVPDLDLRALEQTVIVSVFMSPEQRAGLVRGGIYRVDGLYQQAYQGEGKDEPFISCTAHSLTYKGASFKDYEAIGDRPLVAERDFPRGDLTGYTGRLQKKYYFASIELGEGKGRFLNLSDDVVPEWRYTPHEQKVAIDVLCGGREGVNQLAAQLFIPMNTPCRALTKVYQGSGLELLQCEWSTLAHIVVPHLHGYLLATVDREETGRLDGGGDEEDLVALNSVLRPDVAKTVKACGRPVSLGFVKDEFVTVASTLSDFSAIMSKPLYPNIKIAQVNGLNLLSFLGNGEYLEQAIKRGWMELWMVANWYGPEDVAEHDKVMADVRGWSDVELCSWVRKKKKPGVGIYVVPTSTCPGQLHEFVCSNGPPVGVKYFQEDGQEEEEEEVDVKRAKMSNE